MADQILTVGGQEFRLAVVEDLNHDWLACASRRDDGSLSISVAVNVEKAEDNPPTPNSLEDVLAALLERRYLSTGDGRSAKVIDSEDVSEVFAQAKAGTLPRVEKE